MIIFIIERFSWWDL